VAEGTLELTTRIKGIYGAQPEPLRAGQKPKTYPHARREEKEMRIMQRKDEGPFYEVYCYAIRLSGHYNPHSSAPELR
jgi:hypothetical protein